MLSQFLLYSIVTHTHTHTHTYIYIHTFYILFHHGDWLKFSVLYSRTLLCIHSKCNDLHIP